MFEHSYGVGKKNLSMVFGMFIFLTFLVDQIQQMSGPLFRSAWKSAGSKRNPGEKIRRVFHLLPSNPWRCSAGIAVR